MTTKHPKNDLQEIFQRQQLPVPTYTSQIIGIENGKHLWQASVTLYDGRSIQGDVCTNKIQAESSAALNAKIDLETHRIAVLVDVESVPKFIDYISERLSEFTVYAFVHEFHFLAEKQFPQGVIPMITAHIPIYMSMSLGMMLDCEAFDEYIIVTTASHAQTLANMVSTSYLGWEPKPARVVTNISEL